MNWIAARAANFAKLMMERDRLAAIAAAPCATSADKAALAAANANIHAALVRMAAMGDPVTSYAPSQIPAVSAAAKVIMPVRPSAPVGPTRTVKRKPTDAEEAERLAAEIIAAAGMAERSDA